MRYLNLSSTFSNAKTSVTRVPYHRANPRLTGPSINRPGSTGRYIQLFNLKFTRFTVEKN